MPEVRKINRFNCGFILGAVKAILYLMYRPKIVYKDKSVKEITRPVIFVCNHSDHADGVFMGAVLGRYKPYTLVAKDWYDKKFLGFFLKRVRTVPVDRQNPDAEWYITAQKLVREGRSFIIFPPGNTTSKEFKSGAALLAAKTGADVIPCAIAGEYHKFIGKRQRVVIGTPIEMNCPPDKRLSQYAREQTKIIQDEVNKLMSE